MATVNFIDQLDVPIGCPITKDGKKIGTVIASNVDHYGRTIITAEVDPDVIFELHYPLHTSMSSKIEQFSTKK